MCRPGHWVRARKSARECSAPGFRGTCTRTTERRTSSGTRREGRIRHLGKGERRERDDGDDGRVSSVGVIRILHRDLTRYAGGYGGCSESSDSRRDVDRCRAMYAVRQRQVFSSCSRARSQRSFMAARSASVPDARSIASVVAVVRDSMS